jgi:hypothetical protein
MNNIKLSQCICLVIFSHSAVSFFVPSFSYIIWKFFFFFFFLATKLYWWWNKTILSYKYGKRKTITYSIAIRLDEGRKTKKRHLTFVFCLGSLYRDVVLCIQCSLKWCTMLLCISVKLVCNVVSLFHIIWKWVNRFAYSFFCIHLFLFLSFIFILYMKSSQSICLFVFSHSAIAFSFPLFSYIISWRESMYLLTRFLAFSYFFFFPSFSYYIWNGVNLFAYSFSRI